jgi:hypothetical protein
VKVRLPSARGALRSRWLPWSVAAVALVGAGILAVLWQGERSEDRARQEVQAVARGFLLALTNFDAQTIDRDVAEIRSHAIGDFAEEVEETFGPERVAAIRQTGAVSVGQVDSVFVQDLSGDSATVFGVVTEILKNEASAPRTEVLRVEVGMIRTEEAWKVHSVEVLQTPGT